MKRNPFVAFLALLASILSLPLVVLAATSYSAGTLLQTGDVTTSHILNGTVLDTDVSNTAGISATKVNPGGSNGALPYSTGSKFATSTGFSLDPTRVTLIVGSSTPSLTATSSGSIYASGLVQAGTIEATSTVKLRGVTYTPPSADGTSGYSLQTNGAGVLSWASAGGSSLTTTFTAGEAIDTGAPIIIASTTAATTKLDTAATGSLNGWGSTGSPKVGTSFQESSALCFTRVRTSLKTVGTPVDNVIVTINTDNAGQPSDATLATSTIASGSLTGSMAYYNLDLDAEVCTTANTKYHVVFQRSGAASDVNYYDNAVGAASTYANGERHYHNGTIWQTDGTIDREVILQSVAVAGQAYQGEADLWNAWESFVGFAQATTTKNGTVTARIAGIANDVIGVVPGLRYYLSNTAGRVSSTAGTNSRKVGIGVGTNSILITNEW